MTSASASRRALSRIRIWTAVFIAGLVLSGATAIPIGTELNLAPQLFRPTSLTPGDAPSTPAEWLGRVREGVQTTYARYPFIAYGTDWLVFGHFAIAVLFLGAWRDPVRNAWLFRGGIAVCLLVIPFALGLGAWRGAPLWWRPIDCSFGLGGLLPLGFCLRWLKRVSVPAAPDSAVTSER